MVFELEVKEQRERAENEVQKDDHEGKRRGVIEVAEQKRGSCPSP
jgi:hypothetical protein